ncbi:MAG: calcium-binding protein [bacterium]|nr:calcium-binding protein [bacterium]
MKLLSYKTLRLLSLTLIVAVLVSQTQLIENLLSPKHAYAVGDLTVSWEGAGTGDTGPMFTVSNMAPGQSEEKTITVTNNAASARPVAIKGVKTSGAPSFPTVLDVQIKDGATVLYNDTLAQFFTDSLDPEGIPLSTIGPGGSKAYDFIVTFQESAGNEFQNAEVVFNLTIGIGTDIPAECEALLPPGKFPIFGTSGNDFIKGTLKNDVIITFEGNDRVLASLGNDCIVGGAGNDELRGEVGNDFIFGNEGNDFIAGGNNNDYIEGGSGNDTLRGENGVDHIEGQDGNDTITGGNDNDTINGGMGLDKIDGENGRDMIHGNDDNDTLTGGNGNDTLIGDLGTDKADGKSGTDTCDAEAEISCEL